MKYYNLKFNDFEFKRFSHCAKLNNLKLYQLIKKLLNDELVSLFDSVDKCDIDISKSDNK